MSTAVAASQVSVEESSGRLVLSWEQPGKGIAKYFQAAFLCVWLCGWLFGECATTYALWNMGLGGASLFLMVWLCGWTFAGAMAMYALYSLICGPKPEVLVLERETVEHDPGIAIPPRRKSSFSIFGKKSFQRGQITGIRLENSDWGQRLFFEMGFKRREVGRYLSPHDRERVAELLRAWHAGELIQSLKT